MYFVTHVAIDKSDVLHGKEPLKYAELSGRGEAGLGKFAETLAAF